MRLATWTLATTFVVLLCINYSAPQTTPQTTSCSGAYTAFFVVDGSESISDTNFGEVRSALVTFVNQSITSNSGTRVGIVVYSNDVSAEINASSNINSLVNAIQAFTHPKSGTFTHLGIRRAKDLLDMDTSGNPHVMIVMTDGLSNYPDDTRAAAALAKSSGIRVFAVGVNPLLNFPTSPYKIRYERELVDIASDNSTAIQIEDFSSLPVTVANIVQNLCRDIVSVVNRPTSLTLLVGGTASFTVGFNRQPTGGSWRRISPSVADLTNDNRFLKAINNLERTLTVPVVTLGDGGAYAYSVGSLNPQATLTVFTPLTNLTTPAGQAATFATQVTPNNAGDGFWLKDGVGLNTASGKYTITRTSTGRTLVVNNVQSGDQGRYTFSLNGVTTDGYLTVPAVISRQLTDLTVLAGSNPQFTTFVSPPGVTNGVWRKDGTDVTNNGRYVRNTIGTLQTLSIPNAQNVDGGQYSYSVDGSTTQATLTVVGLLDNFTRSVGESQGYLVTVSPTTAGGDWYRNGVLLSNGAKYVITQSAGLRRLTVLNIETADTGEYVYIVNGVESRGYLTVLETRVNGGWSQWSLWDGPCPVTCGSGARKTETRSRRCDSPTPSGGGVPCAGQPTETRNVGCGLGDCATDGVWQGWSNWIENCLATCGVGVRGIQQRERTCTEPTNGGRRCFGESLETKFSICTLPSCAVDGGFTTWGQWSNPPCVVTCNVLATKVISRTRTCTNPSPSGGGRNCTDPYEEFRTVNCNLDACPVDGGVSAWGDWTPPACTDTCGVGVNGFSVRQRQCTNPPPTGGGRDCTQPLQETANLPCTNLPLCPIDGGFTPWSAWSPVVCSRTCGIESTTVTRRRTCTNPSVQNGGRNCTGAYDESLVVDCRLPLCPTDGGFSVWTEWVNLTPCNPTCGPVSSRQIRRRRFCNNPSPSNGGRNCTGNFEETTFVNCVVSGCPRDGGLSPWTPWQGPGCSQTCGPTFNRTDTRSRSCTNPTPLNGGRDCSLLGSVFEFRVLSCGLPNCPVDGGYSQWTNWAGTACTGTCGVSYTRTVTRTRLCNNPVPASGGRNCDLLGASLQTAERLCPLTPCPIDGGYTEWSLWSSPACTATCGPNQRGGVTRSRTCTNPSPQNNGRNCNLLGPSTDFSTRLCGLPNCPINGGYTPWTQWNIPPCTVTCGIATRNVTRRRTCSNPTPAFGGNDCTLLGSSSETVTRSCGLPSCPVDGTYTQWSQWNDPPCNVTCGVTARKVQRRGRTCIQPQFGGLNCVGANIDTREVSCLLNACPVDGGYSLWTNWAGTACTGTCGVSYTRTVTRTRLCNNPVPSSGGRNCDILGASLQTAERLCTLTPCPIDGGFTPWTQWNIPPCDRTCGTFVTRTVSRNRTCTNPVPQFGGASCVGLGSEAEVRSCGLAPCPVDGNWGAWSPWDNPACNVTCGPQALKLISRRRACNSPAPSDGGAPCGGSPDDNRIVNCNLNACPIDGGLTPWAQWNVDPCPVTCGLGVTTGASRTRSCTNPVPANGGADCTGLRVEAITRVCSFTRCPIDGNFGQWSPWDNPSCSVTCGVSATRTLRRTRQCNNPFPQFNGRNCTGDYVSFEIRSCNFNPCPIDGGYTNWEPWSIGPCSATCGPSATRSWSRRRFCTQPPPQFGGAPCSGESSTTESRSCNLPNCPGDGVYLQWTQWVDAPCTQTCGISLTTTSIRRRTCVPPTNGGRPCEGPANQTLLRSCNLPNCPINGGFSNWGQWSPANCPDRCGGSSTVGITRTRECNNPAPQFGGLDCVGVTSQPSTFTCVHPPCPINGAYTPWSNWAVTPCGRTCGEDVFRESSRFRNCTNPAPSNGGLDCVGSPAEYNRTSCNVPRCPIDGGISLWSSWIEDPCPVTCGPGLLVANRYRTCTVPSPRNGGRNCTETRQESINRPCIGPVCPVDGSFTDWTQWNGACTATCGPVDLATVQSRTRRCIEPTNGGAPCLGLRLEFRNQSCNLPRCPVDGQPGTWSIWTPGQCTASCGITATRTETRTRQCNNPVAAFGGRPCTDLLFASRQVNCRFGPCPINGGFTQWTPWSEPECPGTCGPSFKTLTRRRTCTNPPPQFGGLNCNGLTLDTETRPCNNTNCPVDGVISSWTEWTNSTCPLTCGRALKVDIRTRACTNPAPLFGGRVCPETRFEQRSVICIDTPCPINGGFSNWGPWSPSACSITCGVGTLSRTRQRFCNNPTPAGGGRPCVGSFTDSGSISCGLDPCPRDGNVTPWSTWSAPNCIATCGSINTTRTLQRFRNCTNPPPANGGRYCVQPLLDTMEFVCVVPLCPVDGGVSAWSEWTGPACNCFAGSTRSLTRFRTCTNPVPSNGGRPCTELLSDRVTRNCDVTNCPVDGNVTLWTPWVDQPCTATCGPAVTRTRTRTRSCTNPPPLNGGNGCSDSLTDTQSISCNLPQCPVDGGVTPWTTWTNPSCSRTCGPGIRIRTRSRTCTNPPPAFGGLPCSQLLTDTDAVNCTDRICPVNGGFTPWTDWTDPPCSPTCGNATKIINRFRTCTNPRPAFGGDPCSGLQLDTRVVNCNNPGCIVNGAYTLWTEWSITACPLTCGISSRRRYRFRSCNNPAPDFGGLDCVGNSFETNVVPCSLPVCPIDGGYTEWGLWSGSPCGRTCGRDATRPVTRTRTCTNPTPRNGGRPCVGAPSATETRNCNLEDCPVNGGISQWGQWVESPCSATCGIESRPVYRFRTCSAPYPQNNGLDCTESRNETLVRNCVLPACPIHGGWTLWTTWTPPTCTRTCGRNETYTATRSRTCTNPRPALSGDPCQGSGSEAEVRECNLPVCPINGGITQWGQWDNPACGVTCGISPVKFVTRRRTCTAPPPQFGGLNCTDSRSETIQRPCNVQPCPVNGGYTVWSLWADGACGVTCGPASRTGTRRRTCTSPAPTPGGLNCVGADLETRSLNCFLPVCRVDGGISLWGPWDEPSCSVTCGVGNRVRNRYRFCNNPRPQNGGTNCTGITRTQSEFQTCTGNSCPVDGGFTTWGPWNIPACSITCSEATKLMTRSRTCTLPAPRNNGRDCIGDRIEYNRTDCNNNPCPIHGGYNDWSPWSTPSCPRTCGTNVTRTFIRTRQCINPTPAFGGLNCVAESLQTDIRVCTLPLCPINGGISEWTQWTNNPCLKTCGIGETRTVTRQRTCTNPVPRFNGLQCSERERFQSIQRSCGLPACPLDGNFSPWSAWDNPACGATCGPRAIRTVTRSRTCSNPFPQRGGANCTGLYADTEVRSCGLQNCPINGGLTNWSQWTNSECSRTCGPGTRTRTRGRTCTNPAPRFGGSNCIGALNDVQANVPCFLIACPVNGGVSQWGQWSVPLCTVSCGPAVTSPVIRLRNCTNPRPSNGGLYCTQPLQENSTRNCGLPLCPLDGGYSIWTPWSNPQCSATCGPGITRTLIRTRSCNNPLPRNGGTNCTGPSIEFDTRSCNLNPCPIHGGMTEWSQWADLPCLVTCGIAAVRMGTRTRSCTAPVPQYGGRNCTGPTFGTIQRPCNLPPCPINGVYGNWSPWSDGPCGVTCGVTATKRVTRSRQCNNPAPSFGGAACAGPRDDSKQTNCRLSSCPIHGGYSTWGEWSAGICPRTCGVAARVFTRVRVCTNPSPQFNGRDCTLLGPTTSTESRPCTLPRCPINGGIGPWGQWSGPGCEVTCGDPARTRTVVRVRTCTNPAPQNGGRGCSETRQETLTRLCGLSLCPVDGGLTQWGPWGPPACTATCGAGATGTTTRFRSCTNPPQSNGGRFCSEPLLATKIASCNLDNCPVDGNWTPWTPWLDSGCSVTCGADVTREIYKVRTCSNPSPRNGGKNCTGPGRESFQRNCGLSHCPGLIEGICRDTVNYMGVGYRYHPEDCDKYVMCYYNTTSDVVAVFKTCPFGNYWDQINLRCDRSWKVNCPLEKCNSDCEPIYDMDGSCRAYWACTNGRSEAQCCSMGYRFMPGRGCMPDPFCTDPCPVPCLDGTESCDKQPVWTVRTSYAIQAGSMGWVNSDCPFGQVYDVAKCQCVAQTPSCTVASSVEFDTPSPSGWVLQNVPLFLNQYGRFNGISSVTTSSDLRRQSAASSIAIRFRYRENSPVASRQLLAKSVECADCKNASSLAIYLEPSAVRVEMSTWRGGMVRLLASTSGFQTNDWKTVTVLYEGSALTVVIKTATYEYINRESAPEAILLTCGFTLGSDGSATGGFTGDIDYIRYYRCKPTDFY